MKNKIAPFIHHQITTNKVIMNYYLVILVLTMFSFYKNGIVLYNNDLVGLFGLFKPIIIPILGLIIGYSLEIIDKVFMQNKKKIVINFSGNSFLPLFGALIGLTSSINLNIFFLIIIITSGLLFYKYLSFCPRLNIIAASRLIGAFGLLIINNYSYLNLYEKTKTFSFNFFDLIIGKASGSLGATNIILLILILIILSTTSIYKRSIPLTIIASFTITNFLLILITKDFSLISNIIKSELFFLSIVIASLPMFSPYTKNGKILFGLTIGIIGAVASLYFSAHEGLYLTVLIMSCSSNLFDLISNKKLKR